MPSELIHPLVIGVPPLTLIVILSGVPVVSNDNDKVPLPFAVNVWLMLPDDPLNAVLMSWQVSFRLPILPTHVHSAFKDCPLGHVAVLSIFAPPSSSQQQGALDEVLSHTGLLPHGSSTTQVVPLHVDPAAHPVPTTVQMGYRYHLHTLNLNQ